MHNIVAGKLFVARHQALRGTPCRPYVPDMRVQVGASDVCVYPDVTVSCDARDGQADSTLEHPPDGLPEKADDRQPVPTLGGNPAGREPQQL